MKTRRWMRKEWRIKKREGIEVKTLTMAPWGTQIAVVVLPSNVVPREEAARRLRTGVG
jgi:hypothetical protein